MLCPAGLLAVSLGYFDTLMSASAASTSSELTPAELAAAGIGSGLVRLSVGLTGSLEQRWAQLEEAYRHVATVPRGAKPGYKAVQVGKGGAARCKAAPCDWPTLAGWWVGTQRPPASQPLACILVLRFASAGSASCLWPPAGPHPCR